MAEAVELSKIKKAVVEHFGLRDLAMTSHRRSRHIARPRQIAMTLASEFTPLTLTAIGRHFGNRDHTTVRHAILMVQSLCLSDPAFNAEVQHLRDRLEALP